MCICAHLCVCVRVRVCVCVCVHVYVCVRVCMSQEERVCFINTKLYYPERDMLGPFYKIFDL